MEVFENARVVALERLEVRPGGVPAVDFRECGTRRATMVEQRVVEIEQDSACQLAAIDFSVSAIRASRGSKRGKYQSRRRRADRYDKRPLA